MGERMEYVELWVVLGAALLMGLSPGPATLNIAGAAMEWGRIAALALSFGVIAGALLWALLAGIGLGAMLMDNQALLEICRCAGAVYFARFMVRAGLSAVHARLLKPRAIAAADLRGAFLRGVLLTRAYLRARWVLEAGFAIFFGSAAAVLLAGNRS